MKYFKQYYGQPERSRITYERALHTILGRWEDSDMVRDFLTIPNRIQCTYSCIEVESDSGMTLTSGLYNMLPDGIEYDENGNRLD